MLSLPVPEKNFKLAISDFITLNLLGTFHVKRVFSENNMRYLCSKIILLIQNKNISINFIIYFLYWEILKNFLLIYYNKKRRIKI